MSTHFSANQYENAFTPKKLGNWENPQTYREMPRKVEGYTKIIAPERGHIQSGANRSPENPWGNFVGTWDLPKHIPGNCARVKTARTSYAQQKLNSEAAEANRILSGKIKNETRKASGTSQAGMLGALDADAADYSARSGDIAPVAGGYVPDAPGPATDNLPPELSGSPIVVGPSSPSPPCRPPNELEPQPQDLKY